MLQVARILVDRLAEASRHLQAAVRLAVEDAIARIDHVQTQHHVRHHLQDTALGIDTATQRRVGIRHHALDTAAGRCVHAAPRLRAQRVSDIDGQDALAAKGDVQRVAVEVEIVHIADVVDPRDHARRHRPCRSTTATPLAPAAT